MHTNVERLESTCASVPTAYAAVFLVGVLSAPQEHTRLHPLLQTTKPSQRTLKHLQTKRICVFIEGMFRSMITNHSEV